MPIDFHAPANATTYAGRNAHASWSAAIRGVLDPHDLAVVDVGCGGGVYTQAWLDLGAASVVALDSSEGILASASGRLQGDPRVRLHLGNAVATGLPAGAADVVFARALVHHLSDLTAFAREAARLLRPGGSLLIQDRTMEDVTRPGSPTHPRGYFFEVHPHLLEVEGARRPSHQQIAAAVAEAGFSLGSSQSLWEVRKHYEARQDFLDEIHHRTGRSILHDLDDDQLSHLVSALSDLLPDGEVLEADRWTLWHVKRA